jgi:DNA-3-methyladenine glycosylase I
MNSKKKELIENSGIVRNRLKINAVIENSKAFLEIQKNHASFDNYLWGFVNSKPLTHRDRSKALRISEEMSKELKNQGFKFVGPTICYALMQAVGLINDHEPYCYKAKLI